MVVDGQQCPPGFTSNVIFLFDSNFWLGAKVSSREIPMLLESAKLAQKQKSFGELWATILSTLSWAGETAKMILPAWHIITPNHAIFPENFGATHKISPAQRAQSQKLHTGDLNFLELLTGFCCRVEFVELNRNWSLKGLGRWSYFENEEGPTRSRKILDIFEV